MASFAFGNSQPQSHPFTNATEVQIIHGLGYNPLVYVISGGEMCWANVVYTSDSVVVTFQNSTTGTIHLR
jgi:hypothetical protein